VKPDSILDRDLVEHGFKGGDPSRRERFHTTSLPETRLPAVKATTGGYRSVVARIHQPG
jgi:hypothetical protein